MGPTANKIPPSPPGRFITDPSLRWLSVRLDPLQVQRRRCLHPRAHESGKGVWCEKKERRRGGRGQDCCRSLGKIYMHPCIYVCASDCGVYAACSARVRSLVAQTSALGSALLLGLESFCVRSKEGSTAESVWTASCSLLMGACAPVYYLTGLKCQSQPQSSILVATTLSLLLS